MTGTKKDQQWLTAFVLELSHRGVGGRDAGLAVAGFIWWAARSADPVVRPTLRIS